MIKNGKLLVAGRMDEVVDRFRLADYFVEDERAFPLREGLILLKQAGKRRQAVVDQQQQIPDWLQSQGARQLTLTPMTLEDLFVALAREKEAA